MPNTEEVIEEASGEGLVPIPADSLTPTAQQRNERRFANIETLVYAVVFVALVTLVGIVVAVCAMVVDQLHFNNQTYREQSDKNQAEIQALRAELNSLKPTPTLPATPTQ